MEKAIPGGRSSERGLRDTIERVKQSLCQASGGLNGFEQALRKFGQGDNISQEDLILAMSRVNADVGLEDIKYFF